MTTATKAARRGIPGPIRWILSLAVLHAVTAWVYPWEPASAVERWSRPSTDLAFLLATLGVALLAFGHRRWLLHLAVPFWIFVPVTRAGMSLIPAFYGKPFDLFNDVLMLPGLIHLLTHGFSVFENTCMATGVIFGLALAWFIIVKALGAVFGTRHSSRRTVLVLIAIQALLLGDGIGRRLSSGSSFLVRGAWIELAVQAAKITGSGLWEHRDLWRERVDGIQQELATVATGLEDLERADVFVLFVESYGRALLDDPVDRASFEVLASNLETTLASAGFETVSTYGQPSIVGGQSSLAHTEFFTGIKVEDRRVFELAVASRLEPLPRFFRKAGYHTVTVHPAMPRSWPEGARFFGFEQEVFQHALAYEGHEYPWGNMPDQFALDKVARTVVDAANQPIFLLYASVTSHAPFAAIPPFFEDWNEVGNAGAFRRPPALTFPITWMNYAAHPDRRRAYFESIRYSLRSVFGFVARRTRPTLAIVLGDHQPPGFLPPALSSDRQRDVPVHVAANRPFLLAPFRRFGFDDGLVLPDTAPAFEFKDFLVPFLRAFSRR